MPFQNAAGRGGEHPGAVTCCPAGWATAAARRPVRCSPPRRSRGTAGTGQCVQTLVAIDSGPNAGANTLLEFSPGPGQPQFAVGDHIRVMRQVDAAGRHQLRVLRLRARLAADRPRPRVRGGDRRRGALARVAGAGRHRGRVRGAGGVPAARAARRRARGSGGAGGVGGDPVRGHLPGARRQPADQRRPARAPCRRCCWPPDYPGRQSNWPI